MKNKPNRKANAKNLRGPVFSVNKNNAERDLSLINKKIIY